MDKFFWAFLKGNLLVVILIISITSSYGQLSVTSTASPFTINFDSNVSGVNNGQFAGSGFQSSPGSGQIDSDGISVTGLSDGNLGFGASGTSGDFARGTSTGGVTTGGIYAFEVQTSDYALGFQPGGSDLTPGDIILKVTNSTSSSISILKLAYDIWFFNDQNRSNSVKFSYSIDGSTYTPVSALDFSTPETSDSNPWVAESKITYIDLSGTPIVNGADFYLKWTTNDVSGSGARDELALDNISVTLDPLRDNDSRVSIPATSGPATTTISSTADTEVEAIYVFRFDIEDLGTSDGLPTNVETIRLVPEANNTASWSDHIQGVRIDNGTFLNIESVDISDTYIDISFLDGELQVADNSIEAYELLIYLNTSNITDGGELVFEIDADAIGFSTHLSGTYFASTFPADVTSNKHSVSVDATELRFVQQPPDSVGTYEIMPVDVSVESTDENGNRDLDFTANIEMTTNGTMTGDPISVAAVSGLATWKDLVDPITHTLANTNVELTASSVSISSPADNAVSDLFKVYQTADRLNITSIPKQGQVNQILSTISVSALLPDLSVDINFSGNISLSKNTGTGSISGTLTKSAVNGVAIFNNIKIDAIGDYTITASSAAHITTATSANIVIGSFNQEFQSCPPSGWLSVLNNGNSWFCGSGYASVNGVGGSAATEAWYITPKINPALLTSPIFSFDSWTSGTDVTHPNMEVKYSLDYTGSGNPNVATWTDLAFNLPVEDSQEWIPSGLIDLIAVPSSAYFAFKYTSSGTIAGSAAEWRIDNAMVSDQGCISPAIQASNLSFSDIQSNQMTLNWDNGNGAGRIVVAKAIVAPPELPANGTNYNANSTFATPGTEIIPASTSYVVYKGNGSSVTVTGLAANVTYHYAVYEFNCDATNPTFNTVSPIIGNQITNASDIIAQAGYVYSKLTDYVNYAGISGLTNPLNSRGVFGLTVRDGGAGNPVDGLPTTLTSITFNTNGSDAIRAVTLFDDTNTWIADQIINGIDEFTINGFSYVIGDGTSRNMELRVTFENEVADNEQIVFTVVDAVANPGGTLFVNQDAGGAESSNSPTHNTLDVIASQLKFVQVPQLSIPVNEDFTIEVEAIDVRNSRDLDTTLTVSRISGTGNLTSSSGLTKSTLTGTALWDDLNYDVQESGVVLKVDDGGTFFIETNPPIGSKNKFSKFSFSGAAGNESTYAPDYQPSNTTIGEISRAGDLTPVLGTDAYNASGWSIGAIGIDTLGSYYQFKIQAASGYDFDFTSIEFDCRRSNNGPRNLELRTSADGYATILDNITIPNNDDFQYNQELTTTGITAKTDLIVRIYASAAVSGSGTWRIDNLSVFGLANDIQAPSFSTFYPFADSTRLNGFHLYLNVDEPCTAYYDIRPNVLPAPSIDDVIAGTGIIVGQVNISKIDSTFEQIVTDPFLTDTYDYDVYLVLQDGSGQKSALATITNVRVSNIDSRINDPLTQVASTTIPSSADSTAEAVDIWSFVIRDGGSGDGVPTYVTEMTINQGLSMSGIDYRDIIAGVTLKDSVGNLIPISAQSILANGIQIEIEAGDFVIQDGSFEKVTLGVYLQQTGLLIDGMSLDFTLFPGPFLTSEYGTQFTSPFTTGLVSPTHTIDVVADRLNIASYDAAVNVNKDINLTVEATDAHGNIDTDLSGSTSTITISLGDNLKGGQVSFWKAPPSSSQQLTNGVASWDNIRYSTDDAITLITSSATLISDTTGLIVIGNGPGDLIVTSDYTLTTDLSVDNVDVKSGGTLIVDQGVILTVSGNFNVDGTMNGTSGTVDFDVAGNKLQQITGTTNPVEFYNITISSTGNRGVRSEVDINLNNTLLLSAGSTFDADGLSDDKDFRIVSTPTYTARIGPMGDGAQLDGSVIWERSLRTGPAGYRGIGTPIKSQTIANIRDDVWIQGVTESYPGAWTNLATYNEPVGTTGANGVDGWNFYTSTTNSFTPGVGTRLYLWDQDYGTEQVLINTGAPVIGNGSDNIAGSGETYSFTLDFNSSSYDGGGWNYLSNPYPCELDWDNVNQSGIDGNSVYVYNPDTQSYGTYSAPLGTGVGGASRYVSSGQAFFVKASSGASTLSVSESSKATADGNTFLRVASARASQPAPQIKISIESANHIDETAVAFTDFATDGYDAEFDARKLGGGWVNLSSKVDETSFLAINAMGQNKGVQVVKLNIEAYAFGNYSLNFPQITDFEEGAKIMLRDKYLDKSMVVTSSSIYKFNIDKNKPETFGGDRFELQFLSPLKFRMDKVAAKAGQEFVVPVYADHMMDIVSTDMGLSWDSDALSFVGIEETGDAEIADFDLTAVESGKLIFTNSSESPQAHADDYKMFSLRFKAESGYSTAELQFDTESIRIKAINDIEMPFSTKDQLIDILQNKLIGGSVATYKGVPIDKVLVRAEGEEVMEKDTDQSGKYSLEAYEQSGYTVSASRSAADEKQNTGISTLDIIAARRHILQIREFDNPYQSIAADVNMSKSLTALDLLQLRRIVLGMDKVNESGMNWLIIPKAQDLTSDPFSYDTNLDVSLTGEDVELDFVAVKIGDVNGSWNGVSSGRKLKDQIELNLLPELAEEIIEVPVIAKDFKGVSGYQFSISWDPSQLEYQGLVETTLQGQYNEDLTSDGILTTLWDDPNGKTVALEDGSVVFMLRFTARSKQSKSVIEINSAVTEAVAFDGNLNAMGIKSTSTSVDLESLRNGSLKLSQNVPNPFDYSTTISFRVPKAGKVKLTVINMLGEMIYQHERDYRAGAYSIDWNKKQSSRTVRSGVYMYRLESNGEEIVKKMLIK